MIEKLPRLKAVLRQAVEQASPNSLQIFDLEIDHLIDDAAQDRRPDRFVPGASSHFGLSPNELAASVEYAKDISIYKGVVTSALSALKAFGFFNKSKPTPIEGATLEKLRDRWRVELEREGVSELHSKVLSQQFADDLLRASEIG